jgi:hypothetical protein
MPMTFLLRRAAGSPPVDGLPGPPEARRLARDAFDLDALVERLALV